MELTRSVTDDRKSKPQQSQISAGKKLLGKPDAGKPHVRFEVAGDGNVTGRCARHCSTLR